jgi:hypothetical protein
MKKIYSPASSEKSKEKPFAFSNLFKRKCIYPLLLFFAFIFISADGWGQCTNSTPYGTGTAPTSGSVTLTTCAYASEYSTINSVVAGTTYQSTSTGGAGNYITIRSGTYNGAVVAHGWSPLTWTATTSGTHFHHVNTNSSCGTDATCHTNTITFISGGGGGTQCQYTFRLTDSYGDGWNGATMQIRQGTTIITTLGPTFTYGSQLDVPVSLNDGTTYNLYYSYGGSWPSEVGIQVYDNNSTLIYSIGAGGGTVGTTLTTWTVNCGGPSCTTPGTPVSLSGSATGQTTASLSWSAGSPVGSPTVTYFWEVRTTGGTTVASGNTTGTSASATGLTCNTAYNFRVYAQTSCNSTSSSWSANSANFTTSACALSCDYTVPFSGNNSITTSSGFICDHAGWGTAYSNNANGYTVINPSVSGSNVRLTFTHIDMECCCDFISVYDGAGIGGTLLGSYNCTTLPPVLTSTVGPLTIQFTSDVSVVGQGFRAEISNILPPCELQVTVTPTTTFCDELTWSLRNTFNTPVLSGGPYSDCSISYTGTHQGVNPPYSFIINTQGSYNDNTANYVIRLNGAIIHSGSIGGGQNVQINNIDCSTPPCTVSCPSGGIAENETCGADNNGGCNGSPVAFETATPNTTKCGTLWATGGNRDTDWYQLTLTGPSQVVLHANSEAPTDIYHLSIPDCSNVTVINSMQVGPCSQGTLNVGTLPAGTHYFWAGLPVFDGFPCSVNYWLEFEVTCVQPSTPVASGATTICSGNLANISATSTNATLIYWYTASCGGTLVGTSAPGSAFPVSPTTTTTYYARGYNASVSGCFSASCGSITVTVNPLPVAPTSVQASQPTICAGQSTTLSYTGGSGTTFGWYTSSCGGSLVGTGNNLSVSPTTTTTYFGRWENSCGNSTCQTVTVTVNPLPVAPSSVQASQTTICATQSTTLSYTGGSGTTFGWYTSSCGGSLVGTDNNLNVSPLMTTTYYGRWENSCGESTCLDVTVTVNPQPQGSIAGNTICSGGTGQLTFTSTAGTGPFSLVINGQTYSSVTSGVAFNANPNPAVTTNYTLASITDNNGCIRTSGFSGASATITVNEVTAGVIEDNQSINYNTQPAEFTVVTAATGTGTLTYQWESSTTDCSSGFAPISGAVSETYQSPALITTTYFRRIAISTINGVPCSATGNCLEVIVGPPCTNASLSLTSGTGSDAQTVCMNSAIINITYDVGGDATGADVTGLPTGVTGTYNSGVVTISGSPSQTGTFNYTVTTTGTPSPCTDTDANGTIAVNPVPAAVSVSGAGSFCGSTLLTATGGTGGTIYWQNTTSNGTSTTNASTQEYVTATGTYYFRAYDGTCWGDQGSAVVSIESPSSAGLATGDYMWAGTTDTDWTKQSNWLRRTGSGFEVPAALPSNSHNVFVRSYGGGSCPQHYPVLESISEITFNYVEVGSGAQLDVAPGTGLTVTTQIDNDGTFTLRSDVTGTATLITDAVYGSGQFNMQQYLVGSAGSNNQPNGRLYYLASPVAGGTSNTFAPLHDGLNPNPPTLVNKLWSHSEIGETMGNGYSQITGNSTSLNMMQGYVVRMSDNGIVTFSGNSFNVDVVPQITVTRTGSSHPKRGYNLVGNPYPSYLDFDMVDDSHIESSMWYRTSTGSTMVFDTYNKTTQIGTNNNGSGAVTNYLPPMQAFWVLLRDGKTSEDLWFGSWMRSHTGDYLLKSNNENNILRLSIHNTANNNRDEAIIVFNENAEPGVDDWDSKKMSNATAAIPEIWTKEGSENLVINAMPEIIDGMTVPLYMSIGVSGDHSISFDLNKFDNTTEVLLEDLQLSVMHDVRTGDYAFTSNNVSNHNRFVLHFNKNDQGPVWVTKNMGTAVQANWEEVPGAVKYEVRYSDTGGSGIYFPVAQTTMLQRKITGLTPDTDYLLELRYHDGTSWSPWDVFSPVVFNSGEVDFWLTQDIGTKSVVNWTELDEASSYILQYRTGGGSWIIKGIYNTPSTVMGSMIENTEYEFRVISRYDEVSFWHSAPIPVTTNLITFLVSNYTGSQADIGWDPVVNPAASSYILQNRELGTGTHTNSHTAGTSVTISGLDPVKNYEYRLVVRYDELAWGATSWRLLSADTKELKVEFMLKLYPNPVDDMLNVEILSAGDSQHIWKLYDMNGRMVASGMYPVHSGVNVHQIDTKNLPSGLYLMQSDINGVMQSARILKQ